MRHCVSRARASSTHRTTQETIAGVAKRGPTPKLQRQLERLSRLPKAKQKFVSEMLDTVLQQAGS
jgi:hypothetical protein